MRDPVHALKTQVLTKLHDLGCDAEHAVAISELRRSLPRIERRNVFRALLELEEKGFLVLTPEESGSSSAEALSHPGRGVLALIRLAPRSFPDESWPSLRSRVLARVAPLRCGPTPHRPPIAWLRRTLPDVPRARLDRALVLLELAGELQLVAADSPESLEPVLRRGAIDGHDRGLLTYIDPK
jgi:hypothetical protein